MIKVFFVSLGCDKNLVDSEHMLSDLSRRGCVITDEESEADVIIVNSCCFIGDAKEESIQTIIDLGRQKEEGRCKALIVTGCLAQRYKEEIVKEMPEVDAVIGTMSTDKILEAMDRSLKGQDYLQFDDLSRPLIEGKGRLLTTGGHYAYLKIAEGCNKNCTYCIIPKVRGTYRSYPKEEVLREARELVTGGVKELILVAQETTLYGTDIYGHKSLHELINDLCEIPELEWIRILYCYPEEIYDELIDTMATQPKVCHYLDLPIQHADDQILKRMGRRTNRADLEQIVERLRKAIPDIVLRTTLITGFPGETEEQHETLKAFIDKMSFDRLGVFPYSQEEDTPAYSMPDQVPEEVKAARREELMLLQQEISADLTQDRIGETMRVMVEGKVADEPTYVCRTYGDAPGVDGYLFLDTHHQLMSGDFVTVKVTGANEYDLMGELCDEDEYTE